VKRLVLIAISGYLFAATLLAQNGGVVGHVENVMSQPLSGVTVTLFPLASRGSLLLRTAKTDASGLFVLKNVTEGRYQLLLSDEARGVPSDAWSGSLFEVPGGSHVEVDVQAFKLVDVGALKLPNPSAKLTLIVLDANTHKPIKIAQCELRRATNPKIFHSSGSLTGEFSFLLPSTPITLIVKSLGYSDWSFSENGKSYIELSSNRTITVYLSPLSDH
jgi:5-hydroxyisourate hydrolase-like protein (transthyretin family)